MRIAHIVRRFVFEEWGGTESVVWNTVREQLASGDRPEIFCTSALRKAGEGDWEKDSVRIHYLGYRYPYFPMNARDRHELDLKGGSPLVPSLEKAVKAFKPDIVHIHCGGRLAAAAVKLAAKLGVPSVISLHGGDASVPKQELDKMMRPMRGKFPWGGIVDRLKGLRFEPLSRADAILSLSRAECEKLHRTHPKSDVRYFPNGVSVPGGVGTSCAAPERGGFKGRIVSVARIDYQKNQKLLLDVLAAEKDATLRLVGPVTSSWYRDEILKRAKELGVEDRLTIVPPLEYGSAELEREFAGADVFALASVHEPFGIVALEAWTHRLPLMCAHTGGLVDLVRDGENGVSFDAADGASAVAAYRRLAADAALRERLVERAAEDVKAFAWPNLIARLHGIYEELIQRKAVER